MDRSCLWATDAQHRRATHSKSPPNLTGKQLGSSAQATYCCLSPPSGFPLSECRGRAEKSNRAPDAPCPLAYAHTTLLNSLLWKEQGLMVRLLMQLTAQTTAIFNKGAWYKLAFCLLFPFQDQLKLERRQDSF